jgi:hypothetical protein
MNINLNKLFKGEVIPQIHQATLGDELKDYGILQYLEYQDGGTHFNLLDCKENVEIEKIKEIVLKHNHIKGKAKEKLQKLKDKASEIIYEKYPVFKQINASLGTYEATKNSKIKDYIKGIIAQVDKTEALLLACETKKDLEAIEIKIKG